MPRRSLCLFAALACAAAGLAVGTPAAAEQTCEPTLRAALNVSARGAALAILTINGGQARLLLDTGAERTTLTADAARRLGLIADFRHAQTMRGIGGSVSAGEVTTRLVTAGGGTLPGITFAVVPLPLPLPPADGLPVDGLLGADMLGAYDIDLDIGHHMVRLYDPAACAAPSLPWRRDYGEVSGHLSRHHHIAFPVTLDGRKLTAFIDTGAQLSLLDSDASRSVGVTEAAMGGDQPVRMQGVSAEPLIAREHQFARLGLADGIMLAPVLAVARLRLDDADLLMGSDMLMHSRIWLSYSTQRIFVARPE